MQDRTYGGVIWTNHALDRLNQRGIKQGDAWATWRRPDQSRRNQKNGAWVYYKTYGNEKIEVVAKQNEKKEWIILSVWSKPVHEKKESTKTTSKGFNFINKILRR
ncbi:DUF4258 domain-containing protein [Patescibacteria group bacterium]